MHARNRWFSGQRRASQATSMHGKIGSFIKEQIEKMYNPFSLTGKRKWGGAVSKGG